VVDDEANTLASLSRAFRLAGHDAVVSDNATKALDLAKSETFDLILSDVVMPGKDGLWLRESLKNEGVATPVVMMSGQAHIEMAVRATRLGARLPGKTIAQEVVAYPRQCTSAAASRKRKSATQAATRKARDRLAG
jgi:DNA-binding NtrC family response regulator